MTKVMHFLKNGHFDFLNSVFLEDTTPDSFVFLCGILQHLDDISTFSDAGLTIRGVFEIEDDIGIGTSAFMLQLQQLKLKATCVTSLQVKERNPAEVNIVRNI